MGERHKKSTVSTNQKLKRKANFFKIKIKKKIYSSYFLSQIKSQVELRFQTKIYWHLLPKEKSSELLEKSTQNNEENLLQSETQIVEEEEED